MILFKPEHVAPIVLRIKTHTRRRGKPRWRIGAVHQFRTNMPWQDPAGLFGRGRILSVEPTLLLEMSDADAVAEGYPDVDRYVEAYCRINRIHHDDAILEVISDVEFAFIDLKEVTSGG